MREWGKRELGGERGEVERWSKRERREKARERTGNRGRG